MLERSLLSEGAAAGGDNGRAGPGLDIPGERKDRSMRKAFKSVFRAATVMSLLLALACQAKADQITTFDIVNGQLQDGASVTGSITIDTTTGIGTSFYVSIGSPDNQAFTPSNISIFETLPDYGPNDLGQYQSLIFMAKSTVEPDLPRVGFIVPEISLIGYGGGPLAVGAINGNSSYEYGYNGPPDFTP